MKRGEKFEVWSRGFSDREGNLERLYLGNTPLEDGDTLISLVDIPTNYELDFMIIPKEQETDKLSLVTFDGKLRVIQK